MPPTLPEHFERIRAVLDFLALQEAARRLKAAKKARKRHGKAGRADEGRSYLAAPQRWNGLGRELSGVQEWAWADVVRDWNPAHPTRTGQPAKLEARVLLKLPNLQREWMAQEAATRAGSADAAGIAATDAHVDHDAPEGGRTAPVVSFDADDEPGPEQRASDSSPGAAAALWAAIRPARGAKEAAAQESRSRAALGNFWRPDGHSPADKDDPAHKAARDATAGHGHRDGMAQAGGARPRFAAPDALGVLPLFRMWFDRLGGYDGIAAMREEVTRIRRKHGDAEALQRLALLYGDTAAARVIVDTLDDSAPGN
jgi:hypothetical protein